MAMKRLIKQYLFRCREAQIQNVVFGRAEMYHFQFAVALL